MSQHAVLWGQLTQIIFYAILPQVDVALRDNDGKTALELASDDDDDDEEEEEEDGDGNVAEALRTRETLLELGHTC